MFFNFECETYLRNPFQNAKNFPEGCLYIAIKAEQENKDRLSGKYYLHSLYKNVGAYVREPGELQGFASHRFFLAYSRPVWFITDADNKFGFLWGGAQTGGYLSITTKGLT